MRKVLVIGFTTLASFGGWVHAADNNLIDAPEVVAAILPATAASAATAELAPDVLLSAATSKVMATLKRHKNLDTYTPGQMAAMVESAILPLFDFQHMGRLAVAHNWHHASPEQQTALIAEFKTLLLRTYSVELARYHGQAIEYTPLRMAPDESDVTVRSTVKHADTNSIAIDYDMAKTATGWKVYDVNVNGVSKITGYRSPFAQIVGNDGIDGLIKYLAAQNRRTDSALRSDDSAAWAVLFLYSVAPGGLRGH